MIRARIQSSASRCVSCACVWRPITPRKVRETPFASTCLEAVTGQCLLLSQIPPARFAAPALPDSPSGNPTVRRAPGWLVPIAGVTAIVAVLAARSSISAPPLSASDGPTPSVAVLPFANLTGDPSKNYVCDGMSDEILGALMAIDQLHVTGRTSAYSLRSATPNLQEIGRTLGVEAVLSGSVRVAADRLRIVARLTRSMDGVEIWSRTFDAPLERPVALQIEVATAIANAFRIRLDSTSGQAFVRRSNDNADAYDLYLKGRHLAHSRAPANLTRSIELFEQAVRLDPGYALAYAGLGDAYSALAFNGQMEPGGPLARAREAARRAITLDPALGEARAQAAHLTAFVDWDWAAAERQFRRAIRLTPSHPRIHAWFGQTLVVQRRFEEGLEELELAERLDPLATSIVYALGEGYLYAGRHDDALRKAQRLLQINGEGWGGHNLVARASMASRRFENAVPALRRSSGELWADALRLVAAGDRNAARKLIDDRRDAIAATQPFTIASLYASAGDTDQALTWLQRAFQLRQVDIVSAAVDPAFSALRGDARFRAIVGRIGL